MDFTTITFSTNQLITIVGVSFAIVIFVSLLNKILNVINPAIINSKIFQMFQPDINVVLGVVTMYFVKMFPTDTLNLSCGVIIGFGSNWIFKTFKEKFFPDSKE